LLFKDGFVPDYKEKITIEKKTIEKEKDTLQQKLNQLELQRQLSHYTKELHEGSLCPLCGSTEHPSITHFEDVSTESCGIFTCSTRHEDKAHDDE